MRLKYILFTLASLLLSSTSIAQSVNQAKRYYRNEEYAKAKPVFKRYVKAYPNSKYYNLWYGVCCLKTDDANSSIPHLKKAVSRGAKESGYFLAQAYDQTYQFDKAIETYEDYIAKLKRYRKSTEKVEEELSRSQFKLRMLKGVAKITIVDSIVVDKKEFLDAYKLSAESGSISLFSKFFKTDNDSANVGTVYETQLKNKIYYSKRDETDSLLNIYTQNKLLQEWSKPIKLPEHINGNGDTNYPFVMADGVTMYYASNIASGLGKYDIYVTRYNINTDAYMRPANIGMPFNSPYNDYMYVIDEFNDLGWFASDRYQEEGKVCIYIFIPNKRRNVYNYEGTEREKMIRLAKISQIKETWEDPKEVEAAQERLSKLRSSSLKIENKKEVDFTFIINDDNSYHHLSDFKSVKAKNMFLILEQKQKDLIYLQSELSKQREQYHSGDNETRSRLKYSILDLEKNVMLQSTKVEELVKEVRRLELLNE